MVYFILNEFVLYNKTRMIESGFSMLLKKCQKIADDIDKGRVDIISKK